MHPCAQYLSDAPGLREAAARSVRRVTIEYLAHRANCRHSARAARWDRAAPAPRWGRHRRDSGPGPRDPRARPTRCPCDTPHRAAADLRRSGPGSPDPWYSRCAAHSCIAVPGRRHRPRRASAASRAYRRAARRRVFDWAAGGSCRCRYPCRLHQIDSRVPHSRSGRSCRWLASAATRNSSARCRRPPVRPAARPHPGRSATAR